jgi:diguanylate cyclase (GGDEF)-like protein
VAARSWLPSLKKSEDAPPAGGGRLGPDGAARMLELFEGSGKGWFWQTDREGGLTYLSPGVADRLGFAGDEWVGTLFTSLVASDAGGVTGGSERSLHFYFSSQASFVDTLVRANAEEEIWWSLSGQPITDEVGRFFGYRGIATDLTEQRRSEVELNRLARSDSLTGLANREMMRRYVEESLGSATRRRQRCAIFLLDLDRFKMVNDTLGHPVGDTLLRLVALRLKEVIGDAGQVGRLGGDEFQAVFSHFKDEDALGELAARIIERVSQPYSIAGHVVSIGTSIGVAVSDYDDRTPDELVRDADLALYAAKGAGKGTHRFFNPNMHFEARQRQALEADLRVAIKEGQLSVHYQPSVDVRTEEVVGFEALIRWHHPKKGWVSPAQFIPLAEETGLIRQIGEWVLRTACAEAAKWPHRIKLAVNLSPAQFTDPSLPALVMNVLSTCQIPADRLELEITEGLLLQDDAMIHAIIKGLKAIGVRLALDDFGTGYSSLGYLPKVPFDKIKIDQSFVRGASLAGSRKSAVIRAVVSLARELGMETTAEGVETHDELKLMKELGCSMIQGYIYGKPMPAEDALVLVEGSAGVSADGFVKARQERTRLLRTGTIEHEGRSGRVRLRNISPGGAFVECDMPLVPDSEVLLDISSGEPIRAIVRWSFERKAGLQFCRPFEMKALTQRPRD